MQFYGLYLFIEIKDMHQNCEVVCLSYEWFIQAIDIVILTC